MAKPKSDGFSYCQQDTDTFFDAKIRTLIALHGCDGYALWDYIKQAAYREHGFYMEWNEDRQELAAADLHMSYEKIGLILGYLLRRSLFVMVTDTSRNGVKVLTSHGIQKRFQRMAKDTKRCPVIEKSLWLLSEEETLDCISYAQKSDNSGIKRVNSGIKADNSGIMPQRKEKKNKKNKSIPEHMRAAFDAVWEAYPKKAEKENAMDAFMALSENEQKRLLSAVKQAKSSETFTKEHGRFIPRLANFISREDWKQYDKDIGFDLEEIFNAACHRGGDT